jgi:hypothetical protein
VGYPKAKRAKKAQTVLNKFNKIIKQIITFKKPFFTLVNLNRIGWSISPDYTSITHFSMPFPVNIKPGSWSFVFFLSEIKYEISPKVTKNPEIDQATRFKLTTLFSAKLGQI